MRFCFGLLWANMMITVVESLLLGGAVPPGAQITSCLSILLVVDTWAVSGIQLFFFFFF